MILITGISVIPGYSPKIKFMQKLALISFFIMLCLRDPSQMSPEHFSTYSLVIRAYTLISESLLFWEDEVISDGGLFIKWIWTVCTDTD